MGSTRLPGKVLADVVGKPMLYHVVNRARRVKGLDSIVVATTHRPQDDAVERICTEIGSPCFRGSDDDVLDRYYQAAKAFGARVIMRITSDCPLLDPEVSHAVLTRFCRGDVDYASNIQPPTFPDGLDTEIFSFAALEQSWREATLASEREHVTPYMWKNPEKFRLANVTHSPDLSAYRWTVDEAQDLEFVRSVYRSVGRSVFGIGEVIHILGLYPEVGRLEGRSVRNSEHSPDPSSLEQLQFSNLAHRLIPGGAHTYSRGDDQFPANAPRAFVRGKGSRVRDLDGNEYVDWGMGINNVLVGHAEEAIDEAAIAAIRNGQAFSRPTPLEVAVAERLTNLFPGMEMAKFGKNGSDGNTAAIRLARAITGRDLIGYDAAAPFLSIHDWFIGTTAVNAGVPSVVQNLSVSFTFNDIGSVERMFAEHPQKIACLILEVCRETRPVRGFLEGLRRLCDQEGTLLIFDEVVTAFRYALHGAHSLFGVVPDFMSVGKGVANGYSLAGILGKREYMERGGMRHPRERVFFLSTTNGPEQSALAAGLATIEFYLQHDVIAHLYQVGDQLIQGLGEASARHGIAGFVSAASDFSCRPILQCLDSAKQPSMEYRTLFLQEMITRRVFMPWLCPSFRHGNSEISQTLEAFDGACAVYARALAEGSVEGFLIGPPAKPVFRKFT